MYRFFGKLNTGHTGRPVGPLPAPPRDIMIRGARILVTRQLRPLQPLRPFVRQFSQVRMTDVDSVLRAVDRATKTTQPFVEYIFAKAKWDVSLLRQHDSSTNPYGHSVVRYSRIGNSCGTVGPGSGTGMNVSGARKSNLIYF